MYKILISSTSFKSYALSASTIAILCSFLKLRKLISIPNSIKIAYK